MQHRSVNGSATDDGSNITAGKACGPSLCFSSGILRQPHLACFIPELMPLKKAGLARNHRLLSSSQSAVNTADHEKKCLTEATQEDRKMGRSPHSYPDSMCSNEQKAATDIHESLTPVSENVTTLCSTDGNILSDRSQKKAQLTSLETAISTATISPFCIQRIIGWGHKKTADRARRYASEHCLPYVALEDGFLRSLTLASAGYPGMSMVVDHQGIYYDARQPSDLEQLIAEAPQRQGAALLARADSAMQNLKALRLSKYNHAPERQLPACQLPRRILVVDQTAGDASVAGGMADAETFHSMLRDVCKEAVKDVEVWVKVHPDVIAGKKQGYLLEDARRLGCTLLSDDINPWSLFEQVDAVHVVTSQLGFEALLAGLPVTCHGLPFYAGWGLTDDRQTCLRRNQSRSLEQVFAAAYLEYSRYANPYTGQPATLEEILQLLGDQVRQARRLAGNWQGLEFSGWKQKFIGHFLGPWSDIKFEKKPIRAIERIKKSTDPFPPNKILSWAGRTPAERQSQVSEAGGELWLMEDGFLRSVGLGVDLTRPLSLIVDDKAMHFDASRPSSLESWLEHQDVTATALERARLLRERITALGLSKYNSESDELPDVRALAKGREVVLVVGQVESDASIRHACPGIKTNLALLQAARKLHHDAYVIYKPHPDVVSGGRRGDMSARQEKPLWDLELTAGNISQLFAQVDHLHTLCSLAGFEALLRGVTVTTHGLPFYAGWGLTRDQLDCPRRTRRLTLDALVAGALIDYPVYVEPGLGHLCSVETIVTILEQQRAMLRNGTLKISLPWKTRLYRGYRALFIGKH